MDYYDVRVEVKLLEIVSVKAETREQAITQAKEEFYNGGIKGGFICHNFTRQVWGKVLQPTNTSINKSN